MDRKKIVKRFAVKATGVWVMMLLGGAVPVRAADAVEHKYAENQGVRIHYAAMGQGPLVVFIHGFPDFWYSWHHQMDGLKHSFRVVALDTRGYNKSDKPEKQEDYAMRFLVADVAAVIKAEGQEKAVIVGHDWGGAIAWQFAMTMPQMIEKLIIVNLPHPKGVIRELANNPEQQANSQYARDFQHPDSHKRLNARALAGYVSRDEETRALYIKAFENSSFNGMMNYYRQNYPREPYAEGLVDMPKIAIPVLQFHGLQDRALHHHGLNNTWEWLDRDYTLVTIPTAGHWAHHEAADLVTDTMKWWLKMRP
jgi:pimeloyl-ACP methyl ester carboxylesterase